MTRLQVVVDVATGWASPTAPRAIDGPATADAPDVAAWTRSLDPTARLGLHGRTLTQLSRGEPAVPIEEAGDWVKVAAPWQPAPEDARGYPAWLRRAHLSPTDEPTPPPAAAADVSADPLSVLAHAGQFLGLPYLWGYVALGLGLLRAGASGVPGGRCRRTSGCSCPTGSSRTSEAG